MFDDLDDTIGPFQLVDSGNKTLQLFPTPEQKTPVIEHDFLMNGIQDFLTGIESVRTPEDAKQTARIVR
ncbi:hypothetical protein PI125_g10620 [Phytophthora idaei]|nr:hypothetical protein PI125_g10620 [Phytophthora idaei]